MLTREFAQSFSTEWIAAWNAHNIEQVLTHYTEDFEMSSPYIAAIANEPGGKLIGKTVVANYWQTALNKFPSFSFKLNATLIGVDSITLVYEGVKGLAAEIFFFNGDLKIYKASAHSL